VWERFVISLIEILIPLFGLLITTLIGLGIAYLQSKAQEIKHKTARDAVQSALAEADYQAAKAVKAVQQTLVDGFKNAAEDGKLTNEEKRLALEAAKEVFMNSISAGALDTLEAAIGPVKDWLTALLEAKVLELKQSRVAGEVDKLANPT
jgi:hypothetical protein